MGAVELFADRFQICPLPPGRKTTDFIFEPAGKFKHAD